MKAFLDYIKGVLGDSAGIPSTKRIITSLCAVLIMVGYCASLFGNYDVDDNLVDAVMMIVIAGFGFTGVEKFAPKRSSESE
jgi:hypothetical protein